MVPSSLNRLAYFFIWGLLVQCSSNGTTEPIELGASCFDNVQNGDEEEVDCGGSCARPCEPPEPVGIPTTGYTTPLEYSGYTLAWSDEFDENELDATKWSFHLGDGCPGLCNWGNNEEQYFTDSADNLYLQQGNLIITARNQFESGKNYTSSRIHTDDTFEFQFGRVDIRASMPSAPGTWVALFMFNKEYTIADPDAYWPSGGEIDIMEYLGENKDNVLGTAHYGTDFPANHHFDSVDFSSLNGVSFDEEYYVFSIIWEEDSITWLVNDVAYHTISPETTQGNGQPYPFNDEFYFVFALSVGGNLPSASPSPADFPDSLIIDYIRVFQEE
ncbi:family 16 glycosylhydrolase [Allomuricauda sp. SCSIO 65647]|uniref:glycoside hydrolase family 16 protein n=1 Tax=Allomuricauda sp. SCSIO 65647 TaxID=2908843 RepID=UPI001F416F02|nr:glycoside hydrolase family 16 protein [Muricauda sp. SCSIO 65647]UJH68512.1 glycoside hydrolase family 16 protein [Muricauda sp. SCSIO 65647]